MSNRGCKPKPQKIPPTPPGDQKGRKVCQQLRTTEVALPAGRGTGVKATFVIAREFDPPEGAEAVDWRSTDTTPSRAIDLNALLAALDFG